MSGNDIAGRWLRVSGSDQDEINQEPQIDRWIADHGYEVGPTYRLHGKSASKGAQQAKLDEMLEDMRSGVITVLVVWYSARIERRGAYDHFNLAHMVRDAGGRIEYVMEPWLNEVNAMSDAFLAMQAAANKQYTDPWRGAVGIRHRRREVQQEDSADRALQAGSATDIRPVHHWRLATVDSCMAGFAGSANITRAGTLA